MTSPIRVGIAGYGVVGQRRRHYIDRHPALTTVAVCDGKMDGDGQFDDGVRHYTHYKRLLEEDMDVLFVCLTNDLNPDATIDGLEGGLHVFCEKPPGRDIADVVRVIECEKRHPELKLKYGFNHRYHDSVQEALGILRSGDLGHVINMRGVYGKSKFISYGQPSSWRTERSVAGGGILLDQGIHMVDLMRLFAGEFVDVYSFVTNDYWGYDVEDNAYALMRTADGKIAMLHSTATQWRHRFNLDIALERGGLTLSGILSGSKSYGVEKLTVTHASDDDQGDPEEMEIHYDKDSSWEREIADFASAINENRLISEGSSADALETMKLVYRIYCADPKWKARWGLHDVNGPSA
jgi:predicted dehydrogenase